MASYQEDFDDWLTMPPIDSQCMNALMGPTGHRCHCAIPTGTQEPANVDTHTTATEQPSLPSIQWQWRDESVSVGEYQELKAK